MSDGDALGWFAVDDEMNGAPIGERRNGETRDRGERTLVVE